MPESGVFLARLIGDRSPYAFQPLMFDHKTKRYVHDTRPGVPQQGSVFATNDTVGLGGEIVIVHVVDGRLVFQG